MADDPQENLKLLAEELDDLSKLGLRSPVSASLARWFVAGVRAYLSEERKSLDAALGLRGQPGRPPNRSRRLALARKIFAMKEDGKTLSQIADELANSSSNEPLDERSLRRLLSEFEAEIMAEKLSDRLKLDKGGR